MTNCLLCCPYLIHKSIEYQDIHNEFSMFLVDELVDSVKLCFESL